MQKRGENKRKFSIALFILLLLNLLMIEEVFALTSQTANVVHGSSPYISFDGGYTATDSVLPLISITLPENKVINSVEDRSTPSNPIFINKVSPIFSDINTYLPHDKYPSVGLSNIILTNDFWADNDGDELSFITGNFNVKWQNSLGEDVTEFIKSNPNSDLDACKSPYKLTITVDDGILVSNYGIPKQGNFNGGSHSYYISTNSPKACYAKPSILNGTGVFLGPPEQWDANKGFKRQNIAIPDSNFPTTGSHGLDFELLLEGVTSQQVILVNGTTISPISGNGVSLLLTPKSNNVLNIKLLGPNHKSASKIFSPSLFKIYADNAKKQLLYSFNLSRWYIANSEGPREKGEVNTTFETAKIYCQQLGAYRLPSVRDYSNGNSADWHEGIPNFNHFEYQRRISYKNTQSQWVGGIFNEWGMTYTNEGEYIDSDWLYWHGYWSSDVYVDGNPYYVDPSVLGGGSGIVHAYPATYPNIRVACVNAY
ncbi:hypothetical protein B6D17_08150 [Gilliamella apis]|nr:hypothetical protein B6D17_08150 [Gilliamella apis]OTQ72329.1 hypothetical protein B6C90_11020 [Gilliamella apis]